MVPVRMCVPYLLARTNIKAVLSLYDDQKEVMGPLSLILSIQDGSTPNKPYWIEVSL